jgi:hypothetical protein
MIFWFPPILHVYIIVLPLDPVMETTGIYEAVVSFECHPQSRGDRIYTCKHAIVVASHPRSANMAMQQACLFFFV